MTKYEQTQKDSETLRDVMRDLSKQGVVIEYVRTGNRLEYCITSRPLTIAETTRIQTASGGKTLTETL